MLVLLGQEKERNVGKRGTVFFLLKIEKYTLALYVPRSPITYS